LKPCVTGIVLATGGYMVIHNVMPLTGGTVVDASALLITLMLALLIFLVPKATGKKLSSIGLILCSAILGVLIFGI
jgi:chromate transporter